MKKTWIDYFCISLVFLQVLTRVEEKRLYSTSILHLRHKSYKSTTTIAKHMKKNPNCNKYLDINYFIVLMKVMVV